MSDVRIVQLPRDLTRGDLADRAVVVIDTLRATTTIAYALAAGATHVRPVAGVDEARAMRSADPAVILAGERGCVKVDGFDLGNSPAEFTTQSVGGRPVVLTTTNGTAALAAVGDAAEVYTAALVNAAATADHLRRRAVTLLCAGTDGEPAAEDDAAARLIRADLLGEPRPDVEAAIRDSRGAANLRAVGQGGDVNLALQVDAVPVVCGLRGGRLLREG